MFLPIVTVSNQIKIAVTDVDPLLKPAGFGIVAKQPFAGVPTPPHALFAG